MDFNGSGTKVISTNSSYNTNIFNSTNENGELNLSQDYLDIILKAFNDNNFVGSITNWQYRDFKGLFDSGVYNKILKSINNDLNKKGIPSIKYMTFGVGCNFDNSPKKLRIAIQFENFENIVNISNTSDQGWNLEGKKGWVQLPIFTA